MREDFPINQGVESGDLGFQLTKVLAQDSAMLHVQEEGRSEVAKIQLKISANPNYFTGTMKTNFFHHTPRREKGVSSCTSIKRGGLLLAHKINLSPHKFSPHISQQFKIFIISFHTQQKSPFYPSPFPSFLPHTHRLPFSSPTNQPISQSILRHLSLSGVPSAFSVLYTICSSKGKSPSPPLSFHFSSPFIP